MARPTRYPDHPEWKRVADMNTDFLQTFGTIELRERGNGTSQGLPLPG